MNSAADRTPSGRRIFSRIKSPFTSSARQIPDFSIQRDGEEELKKYSPGETVTGHVRLRVARPIRITHLVVCLHGFVQVYKTPGSPGEGFRANSAYLGTRRGKKSAEYFGNGFASLFEDEEVLCGDGRLAEGEYRFNFELQFPKSGVPSSIEFERGTISYIITATLTRPNHMSPTMSCDRKVELVESIDVSSLDAPKPRMITLEAVSKRPRTKTPARKLVDVTDRNRSSHSQHTESEVPRPSNASSAPSTRPSSHVPGSPAPSETSSESRANSMRRSSQPDATFQESITSTPTPSLTFKSNASKVSLTNKVIHAKIESQVGGCLQGDYIPVKVNVSHTKLITSVYGVIVTLYRQARVDTRPSIPLGPIEKGKEGKYEDYYPRSMTGLGGLSLSGAGTSHVFRKDLTQAMASLYTDKQSLTAEVHAKVRVPTEAFPTVSGVPGAMISFKYYVEVIVDVQGKLQGLEKNANNLAGQVPPTGHFLDAEGSEMERSAFTPFGSTILDTASIRRDKGVVTSTFEVIIGTTDSERRKGKKKTIDQPIDLERPLQQGTTLDQNVDMDQDGQSDAYWFSANGYTNHHWYGEYPYDYQAAEQHPATYYEQLYSPAPHPSTSVAIPTLPDESNMTEKERIRQAETRLLPSQPPGVEQESWDASVGATAPYLPDEHVDGLERMPLPTLPQYEQVATSSVTRNSNGLPFTGDNTDQSATIAESSATHSRLTTTRSLQYADEEDPRQPHIPDVHSGPVADSGAEDTQDPSLITENHPTAPTHDDLEDGLDDENDTHADAVASFELPTYQQ